VNQKSPKGYEESARLYDANLSPRQHRLMRLEQYVNCTQYDGRKSWWDDSVPLQERAPCITYPVARCAIQSNTDLVLGEGRFPEFSTGQSENESSEENGLSVEESKHVDRFIREYHRICRFRSHSRDAFSSAQGTGSCAVVHGARNGKPFADLIPAKWCEPTTDIDGTVLRLEIQYPFQEHYREAGGAWAVKTKLYRRVIDAQSDTEYHYADARDDAVAIDWKVNPQRTVKHGFGYCPVIWYPFMKGCVPVNVVDGHAIHGALYHEIEAHDFAISQRHRAALYAGDPQLVEIGVEPGYNPSSPGRTAGIPATADGGQPTKDNPVIGMYYPDGAGPTRQARRRGAGVVWQYEAEDVKVEMLTLPAEALKAVADNAQDIRIKLQEALGVIFLDPENVKFAATTSGKALQAIKQRQIDRCDQYRDDLDERFFQPSVSMQLRIAHTLMSRNSKALNVPGAAKVRPILDKFVVPEVKDESSGAVIAPAGWQIPTLQVRWGEYFRPDIEDQTKVVEMVHKALEASEPTLTLMTAVQKLQPIFGFENAAAYVKELEAERTRRTKEAADKFAAEQGALHAAAAKLTEEDDADPGATGSGSGKEPSPTPRGRGRRAVPADAATE
jgi:hypothetical protein